VSYPNTVAGCPESARRDDGTFHSFATVYDQIIS
jgi:hypothetical protein